MNNRHIKRAIRSINQLSFENNLKQISDLNRVRSYNFSITVYGLPIFIFVLPIFNSSHTFGEWDYQLYGAIESFTFQENF